MAYGNQTKESNLTTVTSVSSGDKIRVVVNGLSRNITVGDFNTSSSSAFATTTVSSAFTATAGNQMIFCDVSAAGFTVTLPDATTAGIGVAIYVKKIDASTNNVTIAAGAGDSIDGSATAILSGSGGARPWVRLISDGANWYIIGG